MKRLNIDFGLSPAAPFTDDEMFASSVDLRACMGDATARRWLATIADRDATIARLRREVVAWRARHDDYHAMRPESVWFVDDYWREVEQARRVNEDADRG